MKNDKIDLLDHGFVRCIDAMGDDLSVVRAARVSYDAAWRAGEDQGSDQRLIQYLWKHKHTSPFESVVFTFEVKAPIFVLRQWMRHRTQSYSELSARYRELSQEFYVPRPEMIGTQSENNKQARDLTTSIDQTKSARIIEETCQFAFQRYEELLERGVPREIARTILPLSTYSHMFCTVNLRNLFHFISLRADAHAQYEIRVYAEALLELIHPIVPVCVEAFTASHIAPKVAA